MKTFLSFLVFSTLALGQSSSTPDLAANKIRFFAQALGATCTAGWAGFDNTFANKFAYCDPANTWRHVAAIDLANAFSQPQTFNDSLVLQNLASNPTPATAGRVYYNTTQSRVGWADGTVFQFTPGLDLQNTFGAKQTFTSEIVLSGDTPATNRGLTLPSTALKFKDTGGTVRTVAALEVAQTYTATQTINNADLDVTGTGTLKVDGTTRVDSSGNADFAGYKIVGPGTNLKIAGGQATLDGAGKLQITTGLATISYLVVTLITGAAPGEYLAHQPNVTCAGAASNGTACVRSSNVTSNFNFDWIALGT